MDIKITCPNPACRQRIAVDESACGNQRTCPACKSLMLVPVLKNIKFSCSNPDCGQHMLVDLADGGRFIRCPACGKPTQAPEIPVKLVVEKKESQRKEERRFFSNIGTLLWGMKRRMNPPVQRLLVGWGIGLGLALSLLITPWIHAWSVRPSRFAAMLDESYPNDVSSLPAKSAAALAKSSRTGTPAKPDRVEKIWCAPVENHAGNTLLCTLEIRKQIGFYLIDLNSLQRHQISLKAPDDYMDGNTVRLFGWSPDDRLLAFSFTSIKTNVLKVVKSQQVVLCDGSSGKIKETIEVDPAARLERGVWLSTNTLVLINNSERVSLINLQSEPSFGRYSKAGWVEFRRLHGSRYKFAADSPQSITYFDKGNIWTHDICRDRPRQLTHFTNARLDWLDYDSEQKNYIFAISYADSTNVHRLFQLNPASGREPEPVQTAVNRAVDGQWLAGNRAVMQISSFGKTNMLTIEGSDQKWRTNYFTDGNLFRWNVSLRRDKVYVAAYDQRKQIRLWEYSVSDKLFRDILAPEVQTPEPAFGKNSLPAVPPPKEIEKAGPVPFTTTNRSGEAVTYYVVAPPKLDTNRKYPVLMALYAMTDYHHSATPLANAGIFYVSTSPFDLNDWRVVPKPEDVAAIRNALAKNPNIDSERIYLSGTSSTSWAVAQAAQEYPDLWRGAFVISATAFPRLPAGGLPFPFFRLFVGQEDMIVRQEMNEQFLLESCQHQVSTRISYHNIGHTFTAHDQKTACADIVDTILTDN